jgi:hypothetical protein
LNSNLLKRNCETFLFFISTHVAFQPSNPLQFLFSIPDRHSHFWPLRPNTGPCRVVFLQHLQAAAAATSPPAGVVCPALPLCAEKLTRSTADSFPLPKMASLHSFPFSRFDFKTIGHIQAHSPAAAFHLPISLLDPAYKRCGYLRLSTPHTTLPLPLFSLDRKLLSTKHLWPPPPFSVTDQIPPLHLRFLPVVRFVSPPPLSILEPSRRAPVAGATREHKLQQARRRAGNMFHRGPTGPVARSTVFSV